ncbi:hypothetical protein GCM10010430_23080 [Kitasatospora cystarginea]|uniref:Uncharacterized protein n=1 Tax=Kitasatospora cystarginea TaxID=58350 RepID=A0ABN3DT25_9ACTN
MRCMLPVLRGMHQALARGSPEPNVIGWNRSVMGQWDSWDVCGGTGARVPTAPGAIGGAKVLDDSRVTLCGGPVASTRLLGEAPGNLFLGRREIADRGREMPGARIAR